MARDGAGARRHRRAGRGDHPCTRARGRPRATSPGFTDPLVDCQHLQAALPRRRPRERAVRAQAVEASRRDAECDLTEARDFNLMFETTIGPGEGRGRDRLPAPRDGAGHLRELQERPAVRAQEAAVRHRADRQVASATRSRPGTSSSARASSSRWRWSSSCRPTRRSSGSSTGCGERMRWYTDLGHPPRPPAPARARRRRAVALLRRGTSDVEYLFPIGWSELEGIANRGDFDLTPARRVLRREARVLRPGDAASATSPT